MTDIQQHLLKLILEIDNICRNNNIIYFLDGGSALGAVRHRGFLPWDDDADIVLTRENWIKLKKEIEEHPLPNRVLVEPTTNSEYPMIYPRYCDTSTTGILRTSMIDQFKSGLFIDIFILDPVIDTQDAIDEYFDILSGYCEYRNPYYYDTVVGANKWYDFFCALAAKEGRSATERYLEEKLFSGKDKEGMTYCFRFDLARYVYPRYLFCKQRYLPVENVMLPVPYEFGDYLRIHYGDLWYMIPQDTEMETHNVVIDLNIPYDKFISNYMWAINKKEAEKTYSKFHQLRLEKWKMTQEIDNARYKLVAKTYSEIIERRTEQTSPLFMLETENYDRLSDLFENYETIQLNRFYYRNQIFIPLNDEQLFCVLRLMIHKGTYYNAAKVLALRKRVRGDLDVRLIELQNIIQDIRGILRYLELHEWTKALTISKRKISQYPDILDFSEAYYRAREHLARAKEDQLSLLEELENGSASLLKREWVSFIRERLAYNIMNRRKKALERIKDLYDSTFNGLLRLEIYDFLEGKTRGEMDCE